MLAPLVPVSKLAAAHKSALATGPFGSSIGSKTFRPSGVPVIRGSNLSEKIDSRLSDEGLVYIDPELAETFARSAVQKGDLVFTCWGTIQQVGLIDGRSKYERYIVSNKQMKLTPDTQKALPLYLYYFFSSALGQKAIADSAIGSSVPGFNLTALRKILIPLPELNQQERVVEVLSVLDDKIELNRQMNQTLEAMARAIFKDWFVDFGPTRRKAAGVTDPVAILGGLLPDPSKAATLADLFPSTFGDNGLPEGWVREPLKSLTELQNGYAFKSSDWRADGAPVVKIGSVKPGYVDLGKSSFVSEDYLVQKPNFALNAGDMLVGLTGYVGETGRVPASKIGVMLNQRVARFLPKHKFKEYVWTCVRQPDFKVYAISNSHGSAQANVSTKSLLQFEIVHPGLAILEAFSEMLEPNFDLSLNMSGENQTLAETRDLLLPKLMSGEITPSELKQIS